MQINQFIRVAALAICGAMATVAHAADISGAGATFPYPLYAKWADTYKKDTGIGLNYQSIGSGGGIKQIEAKTVTFGASDMPLEPKKLQAAGLVQFPTVVGGDRARRQSGWRQGRRFGARWTDARQHFPWQDHQMG